MSNEVMVKNGLPALAGIETLSEKKQKQVIVQEVQADLRSLESITRMYNSIQEDHDLSTDFEIVYRICSALKPGISRQDVISLIKQFARQ